MPTDIYTKSPIASIGHGGKEYAVKNGVASVPDEAVAVLCESHGFSNKPFEDAEEEKPFDLAALTKNQLIALNIDENLGADLKMAMTKDEIHTLVKPLWEAKHPA